MGGGGRKSMLRQSCGENILRLLTFLKHQNYSLNEHLFPLDSNTDQNRWQKIANEEKMPSNRSTDRPRYHFVHFLINYSSSFDVIVTFARVTSSHWVVFI